MAANPIQLYEEAEKMGIDVFWFSLSADQSIAIQMEDGTCAIAIDPWKMGSVSVENVSLAHELGHCETGSFYNHWATFDIREKHENRADKWAVKRLIAEDEFDEAVASGCTDIWSLAEHFNVTPDFMRKAVCWYTHGNLAAELYF